MPQKYAYFGVPHAGGTHSVYRHLRQGLAPHGIEVRWLGAGPGAQRCFVPQSWPEEIAHGAVVAAAIDDEHQRARVVADFLIAERYDGVFVNVLADHTLTNLVRFLPPQLRRVVIVHNITPGTYAAARTVRDFVHAAVGVSPRIRDDLTRRQGFDPQRTFAVCNAFDSPVTDVRKPASDRLRVLSLGRVEDASKGVLWIPKILARIKDVPCQITIAGDGHDLRSLKKACHQAGVAATFVGAVSPEEARLLFAQHDVLLFPSRYEGFGITLVEAMAAGCVPVASQIRGVTDHIVRHGADGLLFPIGNVRQASAHLRSLAGDRTRLAEMAKSARKRAASEFSIAKFAAGYVEVLDAMSRQDLQLAALPWSSWTDPAGLRRSWRSMMPTGLKNVLRTFRERWST